MWILHFEIPYLELWVAFYLIGFLINYSVIKFHIRKHDKIDGYEELYGDVIMTFFAALLSWSLLIPIFILWCISEILNKIPNVNKEVPKWIGYWL